MLVQSYCIAVAAAVVLRQTTPDSALEESDLAQACNPSPLPPPLLRLVGAPWHSQADAMLSLCLWTAPSRVLGCNAHGSATCWPAEGLTTCLLRSVAQLRCRADFLGDATPLHWCHRSG